jgi:murein DD-endopeptidase MepM/ murein hydrolase activator NlpD
MTRWFFRRIRFSIFQAVFFVLICLYSAFHYFGKDSLLLKDNPSTRNTLMAITPIVPVLPFKNERPQLQLKRVLIEKNQTFSQLMQQQGFQADTIQKVYEAAKGHYNLAQIHAGKDLQIITDTANVFRKLEYSIDPTETLIVRDQGGNFQSEMLSHPVETRVLQLGGYIENSLYSTVDRLGETDDLVIQFAEIFEWDVDFFKDLQPGDSFRIIYEKQYVQDNPYGFGKILAAELVNKGKLYQAIGYQQGKNWEYFSPDGKAMKKAFLASPLKFTRISSGFTPRRYHPLLRRYRPHYGIDYAAPTGTPVRAIGRGRVILAGWGGGGGKTIKLQHDRDIQTLYCHLSRFASCIKRGASVSQGQVIGYVGSTGLATGPHLDFRFQKNGKYVNFLSVKSPQAEPLSAAEIFRFQSSTGDILGRLQKVELRLAPSNVASLSASPVQLSEAVN